MLNFSKHQYEEINTKMHLRKSLLFKNTNIWIKKNGDPYCDLKMGKFSGFIYSPYFRLEVWKT